jgi:hypothetical protein
MLDDIMGGKYDSRLDEIIEAVRERRRIVNKRFAQSLQVGDRIRFNEFVSPKYLQGARGVVTGKLRANVTVVLDETQGRFRASSPIRTNPGLIEKAES